MISPTSALAEALKGDQRSVERFEIPPGKLFIGGQWRDARSGKTRSSISPIDESEAGVVAEAGVEDAEDAVVAARRAFDEGRWPRMSVYERAKILFKVAELFERYGDELAWRETNDMGKPISMARAVDARIASQLFYYFGGLALAREDSVRPAAAPSFNYVVREPLGVVVAITPFNYPMLSSASKFAPALAAGNTVIHKPASATPLSSVKMAEIFAEAGLPDGVFNLVTGPGSSVGDHFVRHPGVDMVTLTGSTPVGKGMVRESADTLKHLTMELGGKSANIIFDDADLDEAVLRAWFGIFYNKGEQCTAGSRLLVQRGVHDEVINGLTELTELTVKGDPRKPETNFGPLADRSQFEKISQYVQYGQEDGATLHLGGRPYQVDGMNGKGFYFEPTIFTDVRPGMRIYEEEIFGPVLSVTMFDTEEEAIELANGTEYGLASGVHTQSLKRAHRVAARMQAGTTWINSYNQFDSSTPFGGWKQSGFGRECGPEVLDEMTQTRSVWVDLS